MKYAMLTALAAVAVAASMPASADTVIHAAYGSTADSPAFRALEQFRDLVQTRSNGSLKVELFPDRQLGEERETIEGLQFGSIQMTVVATGPLTSFVPEIGAINLPFIFKNSAHVYKVLDGEVGQLFFKKLEPQGIIGLGWWESGWRHITSKEPIATPADMKGLKIRTMQNPIHIAAFKELGAAPTPMASGEMFTSLDQGIIDAEENPAIHIYSNSLWEVQKYVNLTGHLYSPNVVLFSKITWDGLKDGEKKIIADAVNEITPRQREEAAKVEPEFLAKLKEKGMTILKVDTEPFREATADLASKVKVDPELVEKIRAAAN